MANPSEYILPGRKGELKLGFGGEMIPSFTGWSIYPKTRLGSNITHIHFNDEVEKLNNYVLSGGSLQEDIRTDRYIWGILDDYYSDHFTAIATCDTGEAWSGSADETVNHRFGNACQKLDSSGSLESATLTVSLDLSDYDTLNLQVYVPIIDEHESLVVTLTDDDANTLVLTDPEVEVGWNAIVASSEDMTGYSAFDLSDVVEAKIQFEADSESYVLFDSIRATKSGHYPKRIFDVGIQTIKLAWWAGNRALYEIKTACEAEGASFFSDEGGNLVFRNRQFYNLNDEYKQSRWGFNFDNSRDIEYSGQTSRVINKVTVRIQPRELVAEKDIWRYAMTPVLIEPSETKTIWAEFYDPCPTTEAGIVKPEATTDYTANSQADGGGSDMTADLDIDITRFTTSAILEITNDAVSNAYLTFLKVRGTPAERADEIRVAVEDSSSIEDYGVLPTGGYHIFNKYLTDEGYAEILGQQIVDWYAEATKRIILTGRSAPHLQLGDLVAISDKRTGVDHVMRVVSLKNRLDDPEGLMQDIETREVSPFELLSYFTIGTSAIESTDVISP